MTVCNKLVENNIDMSTLSFINLLQVFEKAFNICPVTIKIKKISKTAKNANLTTHEGNTTA